MRVHTRKTTKGSWSADKLKSALIAISEGTHIRKSATMFGIPESTLRRRMKANINTKQIQCIGGSARQTILLFCGTRKTYRRTHFKDV